MIDHIHVLKESPQFGAIVDVSAREVDVWRQHLWITGGEIVQPADLVPLAGELVGKSRAEESRGSGNEKIHGENYNGKWSV